MSYEIPHFITIKDFIKFLDISCYKYSDLYVGKVKNWKTGPGLEHSPFRHNFYAIQLYTKGEGIFRIGNVEHELVDNTIVITPPNEPVSYRLNNSDIDKNVLIFSNKYIEKKLYSKNFLSHYNFLQNINIVPFNVSKSEMEDLLKIFDNIYQEYHSDKADAMEVISATILILFVKIRRLHENYFSTKSLHNSNYTVGQLLTNKFLSLIHSNFNDDNNENFYKPKYYASLFSVHPNYLSSILKKETGKTTKQHLNLKLIHDAKTLLIQSEFSIKEIAFKLNFKESSHFINFFKKETLETPANYRINS